MDYRSMKRRELQALCKKHDIPANSANSVLADKLSELLNKPTSRQRTCMKSDVGTTDESEPAVLRRQAKKVRFSPNNDLVEYELRSGKKEKDMVTETKNRRKSVAKNVAKPVVDNINAVELADDGAQVPVRVTRSRVQGKDDAIPINEKKQGRRAVKDVKKETDAAKELEGNLGKVKRSKVQTLGKGGDVQLDEDKQNKRALKDVEKASESVEGTMVGRVRVTRSKAQSLMEDSIGPNLNPQVKKKSGRRVVNDVDTIEPSKEIMDVPVRVTRSRGQTLTDDVANIVAITQAVKKITRRETKVSDLSNNLSNVASENNQELPRRKSSRTRGVEIATEGGSEKVGHGKRKKRSEEGTAEVSESQHVDKEPRQSRRNRAKVEDSTVLNPSVSKVEMVVDRKVTRSKALLAMKSSEGNNKNRAKNKAEFQRESKLVHQLEEPVEHAGRKNVNRRKSVMQPEEHMDRPARKDTRRNFVMQKGKGKEIDKPLVEKREMVKETKMVESTKVGTPKTVGKRKSKEQSGNLSVLDEHLEDEENVSGLGKGASENVMKAVGSVTRCRKSKRTRGNPVIEDQTIETVYVSPVDESTRRSTRSTSKSEGKAVSYPRKNSVAEKQESGVKTPTSSLDNELPVESAVLEGHQSASQTTVSGAIIKDNSSKRSAKSSELKPSDSEEHVETFNTEGLPVSKSDNIEFDEKVTEIGHTPVVEESVRRLTRSGIRSERNAAVNTTPGRFTRSGIKHRGSKLSETVDNKKQQSQSTHKRQPLADAQMFSPEVTGVGACPDVTNSRVIKNSNFRKNEKTPLTVQKTILAGPISVSAEIIKEAEDQILERSDDLSVSESVRLPTNVTEENRASMSESAIVMENVTLVSAENASGRALGEVMEVAGADIEKSSVQFTCSATEDETGATPDLTENLVSGKQQNSVGLPKFEDETPSGTNFSSIRTPFPTVEVSETMPDVQNENHEVYVKSATFSEVQVQVAVDIEKSVVESGSPDEYRKETESTRSGSMSERLQTDVMVEEPAVSPGVITKGKDGDVDNNHDPISYEAGPAAVRQASFSKRKSKEVEALLEQSVNEAVDQFVTDDGSDAQIEKGYEQDVLAATDPLQNPSAEKHEVADNDAHDDDEERASAQKHLLDESVSEDNGVQVEYDAEANGNVPLEQSTGNDVLQGFAMEENDIKDYVVANEDSLAKQSELSIGKNTTYVTDEEVDDGKELKSEVMPSTSNDVLQMPILNKSDGEDDTVKRSETDLMPSTADSILQDSVLSSGDGDKEHESNLNLSTNIGDDLNMTMEGEPISEPSTTNDIVETPISGNGIEGECDNTLKSHLKPSSGQSDSSTLKETPQTPATNEKDITDSIIDVHKDAVSKSLGDFDGLENATGVTDTKNDISNCESEQKLNKSGSVSPGMSKEQRTGEAETTIDMFGDTKEQIVTTVDHDLDSDKFIGDCSDHGVDEKNIKTLENPTREEASPTVYTKEKSIDDDSGSDRFTEDVGVHESPVAGESLPITYKKEEFSDPPTFFKDEDINKQEESQQASTSVDWGNHSSGIDEYQKPDEIMKGDRVSDLQTSGKASSSMDKSCSPAAGFANSATNLEKASRNEADGKFNQDGHMLKADGTEEFFNWSASDLQGLFATPTSNKSSNVKHDQGFSFPDDRSCDDIQIRGTGGPHDFHSQWDTQPFENDKTKDTATQSKEMFGVSNSDELSHKYFGDEVDGSSDMSLENKKENKP